MGQGFVALDAGEAMRPHVTEMKRSLRRQRRRKSASSPEPQLKPDGQK